MTRWLHFFFALLAASAVAYAPAPKVISSTFDPSVEFLELGVKVGGKQRWKVLGPDVDGRYGGMNGTGGLDGVVDDVGVFRPLVSDARGDVHGTYDPVETEMQWNTSRPTGYGAVPEHRPLALSDSADLGSASAWRGRWVDRSGLYWLGARYYDPVAGRFISCDPYGHDADPSLYAFAGGDPINYFDPDGRFGKQVALAVVDGPPPNITAYNKMVAAMYPPPPPQPEWVPESFEGKVVKATLDSLDRIGKGQIGGGGVGDPSVAPLMFYFTGGRVGAARTTAAVETRAVATTTRATELGVGEATASGGIQIRLNPQMQRMGGANISGANAVVRNWKGEPVRMPRGHAMSPRYPAFSAKPIVDVGPFTSTQREAFLRGDAGGTRISPHHRHQIPTTHGGVIDELPGPGHPSGNVHTAGSPTRHPASSIFNSMPDGDVLRGQEIKTHWHARGHRLVEVSPGVWVDPGL